MLARGESRKNCAHSAAGISCPETPGYRARSSRDNTLSHIALNNLSEFEQWLKSPSDSRPRPQPAIITALEKFVECGVMRYGAVRFRCPDCGYMNTPAAPAYRLPAGRHEGIDPAPADD
ncbi:MAG: transposase zinc-binding domain-containing protein [Elusimicrobia bacterium]|nr:transposase zinc-binding domain-containing protein [Elusimicrobiota bacterium]